MLARSIVLLLVLTLPLAGCSRPAARSAPGTGRAPAPAPFLIGIMTSSVSQGAEDFRAGQQVARTYGPRVRHITYPDDFVNEQETVIAQLTGLAADTNVRVICVAQAIPGSASATRRIRETRPGLLVGFVSPHEDPDLVSAACDISIQADELARGVSIIEAAWKMGAKHFVHYSFPRHLAQLLIARRRDVMKQECARRGLTFHDVTAPDPATDAGGLPAAQRFILVDVPRQIGKLGSHTAFYATNDGMQEPLIKSVLANGGYFVEQDVPGPSTGYPAALGISIPADSADDMAALNARIRQRLADKGASGRFGSWVAPVDMVALRALAHLLVDAAGHQADLRDTATVRRYLEAETGGTPVKVRKYDEKGNLYLVTLDHITY